MQPGQYNLTVTASDGATNTTSCHWYFFMPEPDVGCGEELTGEIHISKIKDYTCIFGKTQTLGINRDTLKIVCDNNIEGVGSVTTSNIEYTANPWHSGFIQNVINANVEDDSGMFCKVRYASKNNDHHRSDVVRYTAGFNILDSDAANEPLYGNDSSSEEMVEPQSLIMMYDTPGANGTTGGFIIERTTTQLDANDNPTIIKLQSITIDLSLATWLVAWKPDNPTEFKFIKYSIWEVTLYVSLTPEPGNDDQGAVLAWLENPYKIETVFASPVDDADPEGYEPVVDPPFANDSQQGTIEEED